MIPVDYKQQVSKGLPRPPICIDKNYKKEHHLASERNVLVLATGGTLCMKPNAEGAYEPVPRYIPETLRGNSALHDRLYYNNHIHNRIRHDDTFVLPVSFSSSALGHSAGQKRKEDEDGIRVVYTIFEYAPLIDSANMSLKDYFKIAADIYSMYNSYDGFVVLHGTDTLAYTASTLSFMFENLGKPVILTGAQVPAAEMRSDAYDNILGSILLAGYCPHIPEVAIFFNRKLLRGNRTSKINADEFDAFNSMNCPPLVSMGISIKVNNDIIFKTTQKARNAMGKNYQAIAGLQTGKFRVAHKWNRMVGLLRIFPAITASTVAKFLETLDGVVLQTYGAGNGPSERADIMRELEKASSRGCLILNCTQCPQGNVTTAYAAGLELEKRGVIAGHDMTVEAALAKLSYVLGLDCNVDEKRQLLKINLRGELTPVASPENQSIDSMGENFYKAFLKSMAEGTNVQSVNEINILKHELYTPLMCQAAYKGNLDHLKLLIDAGADVTKCDYDQRTVLHVASAEGHHDIVKYLLSLGASVHVKDRNGSTPLTDAIDNKNRDIINELIDVGANIESFNIENSKIATILCNLAHENDYEGLDCWLDAQVNVNYQDYDGRTALHVAISSGHFEIVQLLLSNGAKKDLKDKFGQTAIDEAKKNIGNNDQGQSIYEIMFSEIQTKRRGSTTREFNVDGAPSCTLVYEDVANGVQDMTVQDDTVEVDDGDSEKESDDQTEN